ncbi:unnamed protein product [Ceutorhynchus assimilis]|uniref:Uncharacterized protein n=1 Tax=Ceutorhynchus assimilis TaxID=467358 RepID=A0A9N9MHN3_9CUCU|nr:unnamed protein product [Ceutorhynchus assimilis]
MSFSPSSLHAKRFKIFPSLVFQEIFEMFFQENFEMC